MPENSMPSGPPVVTDLIRGSIPAGGWSWYWWVHFDEGDRACACILAATKADGTSSGHDHGEHQHYRTGPHGAGRWHWTSDPDPVGFVMDLDDDAFPPLPDDKDAARTELNRRLAAEHKGVTP